MSRFDETIAGNRFNRNGIGLDHLSLSVTSMADLQTLNTHTNQIGEKLWHSSNATSMPVGPGAAFPT
jgi:hypothetical protein